MSALLARLRDARRGATIVEVGLWMPLISMIGLGMLEYTNFILAGQKLERIATVTADTIARNTVAPSERSFVDTFRAVEKLDAPFDVKKDGRTILTGVIGVNKDGAVVNKVVWQRCDGDLTAATSQIGSEWRATPDYGEGPDVTLPNNVILQQNQMVVVAEVAYRYDPLININQLRRLPPDGIIRQRSMFITRGSAIPNITPSTGVQPKTC
jgi:Flp pilus assembly protein TadG